MTEAFVARDHPARDDVAIAYAPATASDVQLFVEGNNFFPRILDDDKYGDMNAKPLECLACRRAIENLHDASQSGQHLYSILHSMNPPASPNVGP